MMRSMYSGISGLRSHQIKMDVIGNNIANVNTVGFKASRVTFQEIFSQMLKPASAPSDVTGRGGINPQQVGLGVSVASIDVLHTRGSTQRTDRATDLAIEGEGFFVVSDGTNNYYTRAGNFDVDKLGNLVAPGGLKVLGWSEKDADGKVIASGAPREINVANLSMAPKATSEIDFKGNLDDRLETNGTYEYVVAVFDSKGNEHKVTITFEKTNDNEWKWTASCDTANTMDNGTIKFKTNGTFDSVIGDTLQLTNLNSGADDITITIDFSGLTQFADEFTVKAARVNGYPAGTLNSITIDSAGRIIGIYSNGQSQEEAKLAIAKFNNPGGLLKVGNNLFQNTSNSGEPEIGEAGIDGRGTITPGALEMSNVDLAKEFTEMIVAQRGFQANSRIITTSDEILQELVNLKR